MPFSFPSSPTVGDQSTQNGRVYSWTGSAWEIVPIPTTVDAGNLTGTVATARLGSGTADATTFLAGDQSYKALSAAVTFLPGYAGIADAEDYFSRVAAAGGSLSDSTRAAVYRLCCSIQAAGIRNRILRMGIFCGNNLTTALVPLYRGLSTSGTQYGNTTDTNVGPFVSGDYSESSGLNPGASNATKYLATGITPAALPSLSSIHLSVYHAKTTTSGTKDPIGTFGAVGSTDVYILRLNNAAYGNAQLGASTNVAGGNPFRRGWWCVTRESNTFVGSIANGGSCDANATGSIGYLSASTTAATPTSTTRPFFVFGSGNSDTSPNTGALFDGPIMNYTIGTGLTLGDARNLYAAIHAFQVALVRDQTL